MNRQYTLVPNTHSEGEAETILVVDDDDSVRTLVVAILKRAHFNVISADSGADAISLSEKTKGKIDLLLTDWDMPEMSGIALGQTLQVDTPDMFVMLMDSEPETRDLVRLRRPGGFRRSPGEWTPVEL